MIKTSLIPSITFDSDGGIYVPSLYNFYADFLSVAGNNLYKYEAKENLINNSTKWTVSYTKLKNYCNFGVNLDIEDDGTTLWDIPELTSQHVNASQIIYTLVGYVGNKRVINYLISKDGGLTYDQIYKTIKLNNDSKQISLIFKFQADYLSSQEWVLTSNHVRTYENSNPNVYIRNDWEHDYEVLTTGFFVYCGFYKEQVWNGSIVTIKTWPKLGWLRRNKTDDWNLYIPDSNKGDWLQAASKASNNANIDIGNFLVRDIINDDSGVRFESTQYDKVIEIILNAQQNDSGNGSDTIDPTYFNSVFTKV